MRKRTKDGPSNFGRIVPTLSASQVHKYDIHLLHGEKRAVPAEPTTKTRAHVHTYTHTHESSGNRRCSCALSRRPLGGPCTPGCKEAGWEGRAWLRLL